MNPTKGPPMTSDKAHELIQTAPVECSEKAIGRLLDICALLNERLNTVEAELDRERMRNKRTADIASRLANGIQRPRIHSGPSGVVDVLCSRPISGDDGTERARAYARAYEIQKRCNLFPDLVEALEDCADFIHALHEATTGEGQIDKNSIMRYGETLKTTARKLDAKAKSILSKAREQ